MSVAVLIFRWKTKSYDALSVILSYDAAVDVSFIFYVSRWGQLYDLWAMEALLEVEQHNNFMAWWNHLSA